MALQSLAGAGFNLESYPSNVNNSPSISLGTMNAAGESVTFIGRVRLENPAGGSKVLSAVGGGALRWKIGSSVPTFSNAATTFRIGVQDVNPATGIEDGVFDVYADLVGGTDVLAANTAYLTPMESGSKTINHNDLIAISFEMISRGGTDNIVLLGNQIVLPFTSTYSIGYPLITVDIGSGPFKTAGGGNVNIEFDDGTLGVIYPSFCLPLSNSITPVSVNLNSTPDELAIVFRLPFTCSVEAIYPAISQVIATDLFEIIIYEDPDTSPTVLQTIAISPLLLISSSNQLPRVPVSETFEAGRWYGIAIRPTTAGSIDVPVIDVGAGNENYKKLMPFGEDIYLYGRSDQTGPFTVVNTRYLPMIRMEISALDDGASGGGRSSVFG